MKLFNFIVLKVQSNHLIRFILVGFLNTLFSYFVYAILIFFGFDYKLANLLALILGILFSFKTQGHFVFFNTDNKLLWKFAFSWTLIYPINIFLIGWFISFHFNAYLAGAMALPFSVALSYLTQRYFVFRRINREGS